MEKKTPDPELTKIAGLVQGTAYIAKIDPVSLAKAIGRLQRKQLK